MSNRSSIRLTTTQRIQIQLIRRGMTSRELALRIGVEESYVSAVIRGVRKAGWVRRLIAQELGVPVTEWWPREAGNGRNRSGKATSRF